MDKTKRITLLLAVALIWATAIQAQGKFSIHGTLQNADGQKVYLCTDESTDSATIINGKFTLQGKIDVPFLNGTLSLGSPTDYMNENKWQIAIEPSDIHVTGNAKGKESICIIGGTAQEELNRIQKETNVFLKSFMELEKSYYTQQDQSAKDSISRLQENYRTQYKEYCENYMRTRTDSYYASQYLYMLMGHMTYEELKATWDNFSPNVQKYGINAQQIKSELETLAKVRPGKLAPDFTTKDINGKTFTLSSLKGKVVIIDFWASWCIPCRKSNPHMRALYAKYHSKGLDMVYVSDDDSNPNKWKDAVEKDQLIGDGFHHVLRGLKVDKAKQTFDKTNDISDKYAIHFLPTKYLIDKNGNIVCKINEGEDAKLAAQIEQLLNAK